MRIGVIGASGYWGRKLLKVAFQSEKANVRICCAGSDLQRLTEAVWECCPAERPGMTLSADAVVGDPTIDAVMVATPADTHFALTRAALVNGKHVFVEKPLCLSGVEAQELADVADACGKVLFVDHTYLHSKCAAHLRARLVQGDIGHPLWCHSNRTQIGIYRNQGILWDLAPHDLSLLQFLFPEASLQSVDVIPWRHYAPAGLSGAGQGADSLMYALRFRGGFHASGLMAWCSPKWARDLTIVGTKGMLLYENNRTVRFFQGDVSTSALPNRVDWVEALPEYSPEDDPLRTSFTTFLELINHPDRQVPAHLSVEFSVKVIETIERMEGRERERVALTEGGH